MIWSTQPSAMEAIAESAACRCCQYSDTRSVFICCTKGGKTTSPARVRQQSSAPRSRSSRPTESLGNPVQGALRDDGHAVIIVVVKVLRTEPVHVLVAFGHDGEENGDELVREVGEAFGHRGCGLCNTEEEPADIVVSEIEWGAGSETHSSAGWRTVSSKDSAE